MTIPVRTLDTVFHVGNLEGRTGPTSSLEGHGLSISLVPDAWRQIARLGGPTHRLSKAEGRFLDALDFMENSDLFKGLSEWAQAEGLIESVTVYEVVWYDDEMERECQMCFTDHETAVVEAEDRECEVMAYEGFIPSDALLAITGYAQKEPLMAHELALLVYTERELKLDGVYWDEDLDPACYSAPRGCIFPSRLDEWTISLDND